MEVQKGQAASTGKSEMADPSEDVKEPSPELLRQMFLGHLKEPVVLHKLLCWPLMSWTWSDWAEKMGSIRLNFREGKKAITREPQYERCCREHRMTLQQFLNTATDDSDNWHYCDYMHIKEFFGTDPKNHPEFMKAVSWARLGFPEYTGAESTLWIGSTGAHTTCHLDTYGCNLVAQIIGKKQWILFPPDTPSLKRSRVPYEEASMYCGRNFYSPEPSIADELQGARVVTLVPGDVLYVPHWWWHYVEHLTPSISLNSWLPLGKVDTEAQLDEVLVRQFVSLITRDLSDSQRLFLVNPNEHDLFDLPLPVMLSQLKYFIDKCGTETEPTTEQTTELMTEPATEQTTELMTEPATEQTTELMTEPPLAKKVKLEQCSIEAFVTEYGDFVDVVPPTPQAELRALFEEKVKMLQKRSATVTPVEDNCDVDLPKKLINAYCDPGVIARVRKNLLASN